MTVNNEASQQERDLPWDLLAVLSAGDPGAKNHKVSEQSWTVQHQKILTTIASVLIALVMFCVRSRWSGCICANRLEALSLLLLCLKFLEPIFTADPWFGHLLFCIPKEDANNVIRGTCPKNQASWPPILFLFSVQWQRCGTTRRGQFLLYNSCRTCCHGQQRQPTEK